MNRQVPSPRRLAGAGVRVVAFLRARAGAIPSWIALVVAAGTTIRAHAFFMRPPIVLSFDEAYINAFAYRLADGHFLPYVDAVSHRGPLLYWLSAALINLGPQFSWMPMRLLALGCALLAIVLAFGAAISAGHRIAAGAVALALPMTSLIALNLPDDGFAFNGEPLLNVFTFASLWILVLAVNRGSAGFSGASGVLLGMAVLAKQTALASLAPLGLWALVVALDLPKPKRMRFVAAFVGGAVGTIVLAIVPYLVSGNLGTLYYYAVRYNAEIYMAPYHGMRLSNLVWPTVLKYVALISAGFALVGWGVVRSAPEGRFSIRRAYRAGGFLITVSLCAGLTLVTANAPQRDFGHYYLLTVPWFGLLFGILLEQGMPELELRRALFAAFVLGPATFVLWGAWGYREKLFREDPNMGGAWRHANRLGICAPIQRASEPSDRLFVWGLDTQLYTWCRRKPASRFVFPTFVGGVIPMATSRIEGPSVPGAMQTLLSDLDASKPKVIVDAPVRFAGRSILMYPELKTLLEERYCRDAQLDDFTLYVRKASPEATCTTQ